MDACMHAGSTVIELDPTGQHGANNHLYDRAGAGFSGCPIICHTMSEALHLAVGRRHAGGSIFTSMFRVPNL